MSRKFAKWALVPSFVLGMLLLLSRPGDKAPLPHFRTNRPAATAPPPPTLLVASTTEPRTTLSDEGSVVNFASSPSYPTLDAALNAARHAMQPLEQTSEHSRGANYFCSSPSQQLRAWFSADGIELASGLPTEGGRDPWNLQLRAVSIGRGSIAHTLQTASITSRGARIELGDVASGVTQWFENRSDGIEQGFVIDHRPPGADNEFRLAMDAGGTLTIKTSDDPSPDTITFCNEDGGAEVTYSGLVSWDAEGNLLPARMETHGSRVTLVVHDKDAVYPVTVDPLFATADSRLLPASKDGSNFGISVALSADTAVIGASEEDTPAGSDKGRAYVFKRTAGVWHGPNKLIASDEFASSFGSKVALSGDTVIVTAYDCAFVFVRSGTAWEEQAKLTATGPDQSADFGASVAVSGNTVVVGAMDEFSQSSLGTAFVFTRSGSMWTEQARIFPSSEFAGNKFGAAVAISGDTILVGAPGPNLAGSFTGNAYVFQRSGTSWPQEQKLIAGDGEAFDRFGTAVSLSLDGNNALVGSPFGGSLAGTDEGSAYVFTRSGSIWSEQDEFFAADGVNLDTFGDAVALSGDTALVGARRDDNSVGEDAGSAYVFTRSGSTWSEQRKITVPDGADYDEFGRSVALFGTTALIGSPFGNGDIDGVEGRGSAYLFEGAGASWSMTEQFSPYLAGPNDELGTSLALSGDNALVGSPREDTPAGEGTGAAYLFVRDGRNWMEQAKFNASDAVYSPVFGGDQFGTTVALSGDAALIGEESSSVAGVYLFERNGVLWGESGKLAASDGSRIGSAVAVSVDTAVIGGEKGGHVFVRNLGVWSEETTLTPPGVDPAAFTAGAVAVEGDVALVGGSGNAYVFERDLGMWSGSALLASDGSSVGGDSLALSGSTALIGDTTFSNLGLAYVFIRTTGSWEEQAQLAALDGVSSEDFGASVAISGDLAVIGAPSSRFSTFYAGSSYVFRRNGQIWFPEVKLTSTIDASGGDAFGYSVALEGELAMVGAPFDESKGTRSGSVYSFTLGLLPEITTQPLSQTVTPGTVVQFSITATGYDTPESPLTYQWRKDGFPLSGATSPTLAIPSAQLSDAGAYDCVVSNLGGVVTSAAATLEVNDLSEFTQLFPTAPPANEGFVIVTLNPPGIGVAWRFEGELVWRPPGIPATGLTTGDRVVEFRPVPGYIQPPAESISAVSGTAIFLDRQYFLAGASSPTGSINVILKPDAIADLGLAETERAQWRFLVIPGAPADPANPWRNSATLVSDLAPGTYLIECKEIVGRTTPAAAAITIGPSTSPAPILTYFLPEASTGTEPTLIPFETVTAAAAQPYAYVGQLRTGVGAGTGFAVQPRVVLTAGHVVFDDGALAAVPNIQWLPQRDRGSYEPTPLIPTGFYLRTGYAAQRSTEGTPGVSTPDSQTLDVAALYFNENALPGGGYSGWLASDATSNEWLTSTEDKILVGYPIDGVEANQVGRMHATPPADFTFSDLSGYPRLYTTTDIRSFGGNSGGPLCVSFTNIAEETSFYPAAVYLGGTGDSVVRTIDSDVIAMIEGAADSAATGDNNTGGGITLSSVSPYASPADPGILSVVIEPAEACDAGAGWRLTPQPDYRPSGTLIAGLQPGTYTLELSVIAGFLPPEIQQVELTGGATNDLTFTYESALTTLEQWRLDNFGSSENTGVGADGNDADLDGQTNEEEFIAGTDPNDPADVLRVALIEKTGNTVAVTLPGKKDRVYQLQRMVVTSPTAPPTWAPFPATAPLAADDPTLTLEDTNATINSAQYRVLVSWP